MGLVGSIDGILMFSDKVGMSVVYFLIVVGECVCVLDENNIVYLWLGMLFVVL